MKDVIEKKSNFISKFFYMITMLIILVSLILSPWILYSMYKEVVSNSSNSDAISLIKPSEAQSIDIDITFNSIDPVNNIANITVAGYKKCTLPSQCLSLGSYLLISEFYMGKENANKIPPYSSIPLPKDNSVFQSTLSFPITGDIASYPYDSWKSNISISVIDPNGNVIPEGDKKINVILDENVTKLRINEYGIVDTKLTNTKIPDLYAFSVGFDRPFYVKYTTSILVLLLFFATLCTIAFTDHAKLIMSSAGIILGIWGARTLIIGSLPPDLTLIDMILLILVILVLMSVAWKVASHIKKGGKFNG